MADIATAIKNINGGGMLTHLLGGTIIIVLVVGLAFLGFLWLRDKKLYKYPVTVIQKKENGGFKEIQGIRGGIIQGQSGVNDFQLKVPGQRKRVNIGYVPDFSLTDADDRITLLMIGDGRTFQQCIKKLIEEKEEKVIVINEETGERTEEIITIKLIVEPIPTDIKTVTINAIHGLESMLEQNKLTAMKISIGAFLLMAIVQIIFIFFTTK